MQSACHVFNQLCIHVPCTEAFTHPSVLPDADWKPADKQDFIDTLHKTSGGENGWLAREIIPGKTWNLGNVLCTRSVFKHGKLSKLPLAETASRWLKDTKVTYGSELKPLRKKELEDVPEGQRRIDAAIKKLAYEKALMLQTCPPTKLGVSSPVPADVYSMLQRHITREVERGTSNLCAKVSCVCLCVRAVLALPSLFYLP